jgi:hypothetical protein
MRQRRREHSLLLKISKLLVSLGASVNLSLSHRRRALQSFPLRWCGAGSADPAARNVDATSPRRERWASDRGHREQSADGLGHRSTSSS